MKTHSTNYYNTLITVAEDCKSLKGEMPPVKIDKLTVANLQFDRLMKEPAQVNSDDLIFDIHAQRKELLEGELAEEREKFYSKGQACLRTSPLAKTYGWGIYYDAEGKIRLIDSATEEYQKMLKDDSIKKLPAMRSSKK
ncbi:hypothetical protein SMI01S_14040 [Sphingobacterium mizutaii NBRC 14946 = DSM 11724]|uniref:Uncharacterized protein n=2 Tax=Sphingobacterium mizutaii TaxID=1010 RepID=A0AAJ4XBA2_9SPHI|nr:DUF6157 family protein [Sphingobacterium mizutaii]GEM67798.1 hypothetical protein SMI01S_14040 [Sphingobacterium mizutaii NBRC 14946 = DSM 11724]SDL00247.1 hypothetical protein SAMN05192578_101787 [Sphingobacterium mizutaii]SNV49892.1 Uncharacterised protein [Sphingobacterium mizutaii]